MATKVTSRVIADDAIIRATLGDDSIGSAEIADDAIISALIADDVALGGNPTTTTQSAANSTTRIATTAFVQTAVDADINALIDSAPGTLNTLDEIAAALNDDPTFTTTVNNAIALKAPIANPVFTGNATFDSPTLYVDSSNNRVGIGDTTPSYTLDVAGTLRATGTITGDVTGAITGNASTATALATARTIGGTSFDGTANIAVGLAGTATALASGRTIGMTGDVVWTSPSFDGSGNVTAAGTIQTDAVDIAMLSASGTASSSTFLRGDNSWTAVSTPITALNNATANELVTVGSTTTELDAESALTFDGTTLGIGASAASYAHGDADNFVIYQSDNNMGITIASAADHSGNLWFSDATSGAGQYAGYILYSHADNRMSFGTSSAERMRIDSAGKVGIGTTSPNRTLTIYGSSNGEMNLKNSSADFLIQQEGHNTNLGNSSGSGHIQLFTNNGNATVTMLANGNFGIGTTTPVHPLQVNVDNDGIMINNSGQTNGEFAALYFSAHGVPAPYPKMAIASKRTGDYGVGDMYFAVDSNADEADINIDSDVKMIIKNNGDVLIGQTTQTGYTFAENLVVGTASGNEGITVQSVQNGQGNLAFNRDGGTTAYGRISYQHGTNYMQFYVNNALRMQIGADYLFQLGRAMNTRHPDKDGNAYSLASDCVLTLGGQTGNTQPVIMLANQNIDNNGEMGAITFGSATVKNASIVGVYNNGGNGNLEFKTNKDGTHYTAMKVDNNGRTLVHQLNFGYAAGTGALRTDASFMSGGTSGSNLKYYSDEDSYWYTYSGGWVQRMRMHDGGQIDGDFNDTSDQALKENITDITGGLSIVKQLRPVNFDWKESGRGTGKAGFIAQEVEAILPKEISGDDYAAEVVDDENPENNVTGSAGKALNVTGIVAHMAKAIQELEARIETLENE